MEKSKTQRPAERLRGPVRGREGQREIEHFWRAATGQSANINAHKRHVNKGTGMGQGENEDAGAKTKRNGRDLHGGGTKTPVNY